MAKDDEIKFTITIPTYDRPQKLERAVRSAIVAASEADSGTFEVIVIEQSPNHWKPPDDIYHFVRTITSEFGSVARARNLAFRDCKSNIIIFLDDDCVATKNWVSGYLEFLTEQEHCSVVFGSVLPVEHPQNKSFVLDVTETTFGTEWRGVSENGDQCFALAKFANEICDNSIALPYAKYGSSNSFAARRLSTGRFLEFDDELGAGSTIGAAEDQEWTFRLLYIGHWAGRTTRSLAYHDNWQSPDQANSTLDSYVKGNIAVFLSIALNGNPLCWRIVLHLLRSQFRPIRGYSQGAFTVLLRRVLAMSSGVWLGIWRAWRIFPFRSAKAR